MKKGFILKKLTPIALTCTLTLSLCVSSVYAATTSNAVTSREKQNANLSMNAASEGMVLLENKNNALPIASSGKIALFGGGSCYTLKGGSGSGDVNERYEVSVLDAFENAGYDITSSEWLRKFQKNFKEGKEAYDEANKDNPYKDYLPPFSLKDYNLTDEDISKASDADTAIYVISRSSGEGIDRTATKGSYYLTDEEYSNIKLMANSFKNSIVLLNVGGVIDTKFVEEIPDLDSILLMSQAGMEGGTAAVKLLNGEITPSGKLTDTWARDYSDYPASETFASNDGDSLQEDYSEDIFVGYRYFDSFNKTPAYEFGYGLSYTNFEMKVLSTEADENQVTVKVKVDNTGKYSGKEVVQVYFSAPSGKLDNPYQELAAFSKTDLLEPGESQTLTITYNTSDMSSYSEEDATYIMEKGNYIIRVGNSSRNTHVAAVLTLDSTIATEKLSNQITIDNNIDILSNKSIKPYSYEGENNEIDQAKRISLDPQALELIDGDNASQFDDEAVTTYISKTPSSVTTSSSVTYEKKKDYEEVKYVDTKKDATLYDVYNKNITMEQFIAGLSNEKLAHIVEGVSETSGNGPVIGSEANTIDGGAGETTGKYIESDGIPNVVLVDGPAGIRITQSYEKDGKTYYQYATAWPIGTLLAQTWNTELMEKVNKAVGEEMAEFGATIWLAPGMNIHRDPLCGRNFEYYSEDPYITGIMGVAATKGTQSVSGIGVTIKHFATNNQETERDYENNTISERALREIYLKGFEMAVKGAQPMAIMTGFNKINGIYSGENYDLLSDITRGEWNYDGVIMSDWYTKSDPVISMHAGNDLIMPGGSQSDIMDSVGSEKAALSSESDEETLDLIEKILEEATDYEPIFRNDGFIEGNAWNDFIPDEDGSSTVSTQVSAGESLSDEVLEMIDEGKATIEFVDKAKDNNRVNSDEVTTKSAISIDIDDDILDTLSDCDRIVTYFGEYKDNNVICLGDLQKSAMNVLNVVMQSKKFADMYNVKARSCSAKYSDLEDYLVVHKSNVSAGNNSTSSKHHKKNSSSDDTVLSDKLIEEENNTGWIKGNDGKWYYLNASGTMQTGWLKDSDGKWYYLNASGIMQTGWLKDSDGKWYYLNASGTMQTGWLKDSDGKWYYLNASGTMQTGWLKDSDGKWYCLNASGIMQTGWLKDSNGKWYYLYSNGEMAFNTTINGYALDSTGAYIG